jgi:hypothetical protein
MDRLDKLFKRTANSFIGLVCFAGIILLYNTCTNNKSSFVDKNKTQNTRIDSTIINSTRIVTSDKNQYSSLKSDSLRSETVSLSTYDRSSSDSGILDSIVFNLTLAVNSINNILSSSALALGILTLFLALIGLFGYKTLKDDINKTIDSFKDKIKQDNTKSKIRLSKGLRDSRDISNKTANNVKNIETKLDKKLSEYNRIIEALKHSISEQNRFARQVNNYLYEITYDIAENHIDDDRESKKLLNKLIHERYLANLYLYDADYETDQSLINDKITALEKLEVLFELNDFQHLQYVAKFDIDKSIRNKALEIINNIYAHHISILYDKKSNISELEKAIKLIGKIGKTDDLVHLKMLSNHRNKRIRELVVATIDFIEQSKQTNDNNEENILFVTDLSVIDGL